MILASRHYYRQSRLLLLLSLSGLLAVPLLPLLLPASPALLAALGLVFLLTPIFWLVTVLRLRVLRRDAPEEIGDFPAVARNLLLAAFLWLGGAVALNRAALKLGRIWQGSSAQLQAGQLEQWRRTPLPPLAEIPADCRALARLAGRPEALCLDAMGHSLTVEVRDGKPVLVAPLAGTEVAPVPLHPGSQALAPLPLPLSPVPMPLPLPPEQPPTSTFPPPLARRPKAPPPEPEPPPVEPAEPPQSDPAPDLTAPAAPAQSDPAPLGNL